MQRNWYGALAGGQAGSWLPTGGVLALTSQLALNIKEEKLCGYPWCFIEKRLRRVLRNGLRHQASLEYWDI